MSARLPFLLILLLIPNMACATPPDLAGVGYTQNIGAALPRGAKFRDERGRVIEFDELLHGAPLILLPGYFHCPKLCSLTRANLLSALNASGLVAGRDYVFAALSIDPAETNEAAALAKRGDVSHFASDGEEPYWRYLTGEERDVRVVTRAVGFIDRFDQPARSIVHPTGAVFISPDGRISGYLFGVAFPASDLRTAVARAAAGEMAPKASPILLLCADFDPATGRYSLAIIKLLRLLCAGTIAIIGFMFFRGSICKGARM